MTSNIRKALFKSLMAQSIENENAVVIDNGEEVIMEGQAREGVGGATSKPQYHGLIGCIESHNVHYIINARHACCLGSASVAIHVVIEE